MKALKKDRSSRYETANGLALDVQHYLANEPISARKYTGAFHIERVHKL
jgi:hypothetical protein